MLGREKAPRPVPLWAWPMAAIGIAGVTIGITFLFRGMGDVMAVGGQCAEGGPYVIAQHCPEGTTTLMMVGIFGGLLSLVLATWGLMRISSKAASLVILAWGGLFGALGYNFLYYAQNPPPDMSGTTGWVVCGVLFIIMAIPGILFPLVTFRYIEFARRLPVLLLLLVSIAAGIFAGSALATELTTVKSVGKPAVISVPPGSEDELTSQEQATLQLQEAARQLRQAQQQLREAQLKQQAQHSKQK